MTGYFERRCRICNHPEREQIHIDYLKEKMPATKVQAKWFPDARPVPAVRAVRKHFKSHYSVNALAEKALATIAQQAKQYPQAKIAPAERQLITELVGEKISAAANLETMMRMLFERIDHIQEEYTAVRQGTKCSVCGRDDNGANLSKLLASVREIRELSDSWMRVKNPMQTIRKFFQSTFVEFANSLTQLYVEMLHDKSRILREATNMYVSGTITPALFSKRITEIEDLGVEKISSISAERLRTILSQAMKEMEKKL